MANFCWEIKISLKLLKQLKFLGNLPGKITFFVELPEKNRYFSKICLEKSNFF